MLEKPMLGKPMFAVLYSGNVADGKSSRVHQLSSIVRYASYPIVRGTPAGHMDILQIGVKWQWN